MRKIKTGIVGLGRLGKVHATNVVNYVSQLDLIAACSVVEEELQYASLNLGVEKTYESFEEMIDQADIEAVIIVSPSSLHTKQIEYAFKKGKHVFCEKPIGLEVKEIEQVEAFIEKRKDQVFMLGFMRRFDESYQYAKEMVDRGDIGEITLVRCYGIDPSSGLPSFVQFAKNSHSGGLFIDMAIHDIDLVRWFTGQEIKEVYAIGNNFAYPELAEYGDTETGAALMKLSNDAIAILVSGRNAAHGYHVETEIIGTKGMLRVAQEPEKNLVTIFDEKGVRRPCSEHFPERFKQAFINELIEFAKCIIERQVPGVSAKDGLESTKVALACTKSFETGKLVALEDEAK
ncbi:inositol 2-dehydrogenase [Listeria fleischmannii]|uniref:inositol 2-dehydrogenase n=1 Tax=Listeria fleischmannii TaxID=1069827 RepID=UPI000254F020|nr:inositol 2-dehydrogenase [Listeria fleischmannii]EIA19231.1 myo-inositol 2-dehydrogenase [Listeria fleischmannii subsp. coloradonensis]STY34772.1 Inositol 2-dehydrogenase [Listeria fleischmannii subsp. coloradonensis]